MGATVRLGVGAAVCFLGASRGLPLPELFALAGIDPTQLSDPDQHLSIEAVLAALRRVERHVPDRALGLDLVEMIPSATAAIVDLAASSAPTIYHASQVHARHISLSSSAARMRVTLGERRCEMTFEHHPAVEAIAHPIDAALGQARRTLAAEGATLEAVSFKHTARGPASRYEEFFGCPVRFEQARSCVVLTREQVERPSPNANPELFKLLQQRLAGHLVPPARDDTSVAAQLRQHALQCGFELSRLARRLGTSKRTLQRRASSEGVELRALLEKLRMEHAKAFLVDRALAIEDVALLVSYSDLRGFIRAFKRVEGATPAAYRQRVASSG